MVIVIVYSLLLLAGIFVSQAVNLIPIREQVSLLTTICLSYIMVEVGLEFTLQKDRLKQYAVDFFVATMAASLPWILCAGYFVAFFQMTWKDAGLVGLFSAPTSAGVLFSMLAAAGLGMTWVFKKARVLAIFDDIATILLLIPLQIVLVGMKFQLIAVIFILVFLLWAAYQWINTLKVPIGKFWLFLYSVLVVVTLWIFHQTTHIHLEVLLPAFALGCIIKNPHFAYGADVPHEHTHIEPLKGWPLWFDRFLKGLFMFLVGCSLPKIDIAGMGIGTIIGHVLLLTLISNLGKCFIVFCYKKEASFKLRSALSVAMFPRGEVGAGVLLIALSHGLGGIAASLAVLSLALNLLLTGGFIAIVINLMKGEKNA